MGITSLQMGRGVPINSLAIKGVQELQVPVARGRTILRLMLSSHGPALGTFSFWLGIFNPATQPSGNSAHVLAPFGNNATPFLASLARRKACRPSRRRRIRV